MTAKLIVRGPWRVPVKVVGAMCEDGVRRTAYITGEADTFFSIPARITVKGKTVSGFVHSYEGANGEGDYGFTSYKYRKNWTLVGVVVGLRVRTRSERTGIAHDGEVAALDGDLVKVVFPKGGYGWYGRHELEWLEGER